jgi:GntR family transcriptional regulator
MSPLRLDRRHATTRARGESHAVEKAGSAEAAWPAAGIDRSSPVPYYYQLQEILKEEIEAGRWLPGDLLPSESELENLFGVSRTVIRKALDVLEGDGQVYRVKGKGALVAPPKFRYEAVALAQEWLAPDAEASAGLWMVIHVGSVAAGGLLSRLLDIGPADEVWELVFVSAVLDKPVSLSQMYLRKDASRALRRLKESGAQPVLEPRGPDALRQLAERYGVVVDESRITVESTAANQFESETLRIPENTPVFLLSQLTTDKGERAFAFCRTVVRSDHFRFSVQIRHPLEERS